MNKTDVITQVSQKSGIGTEICERVIKAFEEQSGNALTAKFKGVKNNRSDIVSGIAEKTGYAIDECEKIITVFEDVLDSGLSDKLRFFK